MPSQYRIPLAPAFVERRRRVEVLAGAGITPPARWTELNDRLNDYLGLESTAAAALADAVINPVKGKDLATLRALALAEQTTPQTVAAINGAVVAAVHQEMLAAYRPHARDNYATLAAQFDETADRFTAAATLVDVEAQAVDMVTAAEADRTAWVEAERLAHRLDALLTALAAAAELADAPLRRRLDGPLIPGALLALVVDAGELHRRQVWRAWEHDEGRTRRWAALVTLGARLRAVDLDQFQPYREPAPLIHRQEQVPGAPRGTVRTVTTDPEDPGHTASADPAGDRLVSW